MVINSPKSTWKEILSEVYIYGPAGFPVSVTLSNIDGMFIKIAEESNNSSARIFIALLRFAKHFCKIISFEPPNNTMR